MNQFKYIEGELWLNAKRPFAANYATQESFDQALMNWNSRLHYPCSKELQAKLKEGQVLRGDEFKVVVCNCGIGHDCNINKNNYNKPCKIAIPLPEQPSTEEGQQTSSDVEQAAEDYTRKYNSFNPSIYYAFIAGAKWNQGKEAKPTPVKGDEVKSIDEIGKKYFQCNCGEIYLSRNLTAPDCPYHSLDWESAMEEYANQFKTNK